VLHTLLSSLLWKDEVLQIGLFRTNDDIHKQLFLVEQKIEDLGIPNEKQKKLSIKMFYMKFHLRLILTTKK